VPFSRLLELCTFSNPRRQTVEGRSTILLDFACGPSGSPSAHTRPFSSPSLEWWDRRRGLRSQHVRESWCRRELGRGNIKSARAHESLSPKYEWTQGFGCLSAFTPGRGALLRVHHRWRRNMFAGNYQKLRSASGTRQHRRLRRRCGALGGASAQR